MSEFPNARPDLEDIRWSDVGGTKTDPTALKDNGYPLDATPGSEDRNFQLNALFRWLTHVDGRTPREFDSLRTALDPTDGVKPPQSFRIRTADSGDEVTTRGEQLFDLQGAAGAFAIEAMATDGEQLYYAQNSTVYAVDPDTGDDGNGGGFGTFIWAVAQGAPIRTLAADGAFVIVGLSFGVGLEIRVLNRTTGAFIEGLDRSVPSRVESNGVKLAVGFESTPFDLGVVSGVGGSITSDGTVTFDAAVRAVAIDDQSAWCGGDQDSGGADVHQISLTTVLETLSITLPTTTAPTVRAICTDGSYVFVFVDEVEVIDTGGLLVRAFCIDRLLGSIIWFTNFGTFDPITCAVDHAWLYGTNSNGDTFAFDKSNGKPIWLKSGTAVQAADGVSYFGDNGANNIRRHANGLPTVDMIAVEGGDDGRRPFYNLATPRDEIAKAAIISSPSVYGREREYDDENASTSTSSTTFVEHQTFTTKALVGGTYRIAWYYVWRYDSNAGNNSFEANVDLDEGTIIHNHVEQPQNTQPTDRYIVSGFIEIALTAATHQIDVDLRRVGAAGTVTIEQSRLSIHRVG